MKLHLLPDRCGTAAENMASDFLLLQRYPTEPDAAVRLRHYTWQRPAFTFGFSQHYALVREQLDALAPDEHLDVTRRATGGGIVDHRDDWTYALVIPRGHALEARPASQSYRLVHEALAAALLAQGVPAALKLPDDTCATAAQAAAAPASPPPAKASRPSVAPQCFQRAECFDVILRDRAPCTGSRLHARSPDDNAPEIKLAGAAQKRTKHGLLFQGSVSRAAAGGDATDWERLYTDFAEALARLLAAEAEPVGWPDFATEELEGLIDQYASPEWLTRR